MLNVIDRNCSVMAAIIDMSNFLGNKKVTAISEPLEVWLQKVHACGKLHVPTLTTFLRNIYIYISISYIYGDLRMRRFLAVW